MSINIRDARPADAEDIARMHIASWRAAYAGIVANEWLDSRDLNDNAKRWSDNLNAPKDKKQVTYLAYDGERLAGFATVGESRSDKYSGHAELWAIYAHPDYYGKGVGRALFNKCAAYAAEIGADKMFVNVLTDNPLGRNFYERMGAVVIPDSEGDVMLGEQSYRDIKYEWKELRYE